MIANFLMGWNALMTWQNLLSALGGTVFGIIIGAMPGLSVTMAIVVLIPVTYGMPDLTGLVMMAGAYVGGTYGGSISAILVNTPGTPGSVATAFDGHPMALKGRGQEALIESATASFWGTVIGFIALMTIAPALATFSLKFSAQETVWLALFGLSVIASMASKNMLKGAISACIGFMLGCIGSDPKFGYMRYTFGSYKLYSGISLIPMIIGFYSVSQLIGMVVECLEKVKAGTQNLTILKLNKHKLSLKDICYYPLTYLWCSVIGVVVGIMPAAGTGIAAYMGYDQGKRLSKTPELFGTGIREGLAGPESANNAVIGGSLIPMLTLGIPGNNVSLVLMGAMMLHGLTPGPALFTEKADILYPFMTAILVAAVFMVAVGVIFAPQFAKVNSIPEHFLATLILVLITIGSFSCSNNYFDVYMMLFCGILGYLCKQWDLNVTAIVLGATLGKIAEKGLIRAVTLCNGVGPAVISLFTRPISLVLMILTVGSFLLPSINKKRDQKKAAKRLKEDEK